MIRGASTFSTYSCRITPGDISLRGGLTAGVGRSRVERRLQVGRRQQPCQSRLRSASASSRLCRPRVGAHHPPAARNSLWKPSLLIVTADHGISFRPGEPVRRVDATNIADMPRPTLRQGAGATDRRRRRSKCEDDRHRPHDRRRARSSCSVGIRRPLMLLRNRPYPSEIAVASITGDIVRAPWSVEDGPSEDDRQKDEVVRLGSDPARPGRGRKLARYVSVAVGAPITYAGARRTEPAPWLPLECLPRGRRRGREGRLCRFGGAAGAVARSRRTVARQP